MEENKNNNEGKQGKVMGIGGIFFFSDNIEKTKEWYAKNLGFEINDWGTSSFEYKDLHDPNRKHSVQWAPFKRDSDYFQPSKKDFMINYVVQNLEALVEQLRENGVLILDEISSYEYGKFIHIMDNEGNKIELWEPS